MAAIYGAAVGVRGGAFDRGLLAGEYAGVPVISVGGLEVGGSGKTPVTGLLLNYLRSRGHRVGLLSRGYGRPDSRQRIRRPGEPAKPDLHGDEPTMLVAEGHDVHLGIGPSRRDSAKTLLKEGCSVLVMDDGFSHRYLRRDVDIVVIRAESANASLRLMPWGRLREPLRSVARAHVAWVNSGSAGDQSAARRNECVAWVQKEFPGAHLVVSERSVPVVIDGLAPALTAADALAPDELRGRRVLALCGIAHPQTFSREARAVAGASGMHVVGERHLRDHARYDKELVLRLADEAKAHSADAILTTAKDAIKLREHSTPLPVWVLRSETRIVRGQERLFELLGPARKYADPKY